MNLKWTSVCYKCNAPLHPSISNTTSKQRKFISYYKRIRPIFVINNQLRYSFVGEKVERVCYWCFRNAPKYIFYSLRSREIGKRAYVRSQSKTVNELCNWFDGLTREACKRGLYVHK